jgi:hypothetical protein
MAPVHRDKLNRIWMRPGPGEFLHVFEVESFRRRPCGKR